MAYTQKELPSALDEKTTPVDADNVVVGNSADSNRVYKTTWANVKATLKTYFDTLYSDDQTGAEIKTAYEGEADTNAYTDAEKTKLAGVASGAEANPDVVSQAEAEAGTATTERIWTAQRVAQAIAALAAGGSSDHGGLTGLTDDDHTQYGVISTGAGAPSSTPAREGAVYVDTTNDNVYIAAGSASSADWKQATGAGGGDLLAASNLSDVANAATALANLGGAASSHNHDTVYPTITSGAGAPSSTPTKEGDVYVDTTNDNVYLAAGTASSADWKHVNGASGGASGARTLVVAASDATDGAGADYTCDGTADEVQINAALAAVKAAGGKVLLTDGTFTCAAPIALAGNVANDDDNPQVTLWGAGIDATTINMASGNNGINLTNQPKYDIGFMTIAIAGAANGIDQQAGTERGNWQSIIHDIYIKTDFASHSVDSYGIYLESPFRMRMENIEMNGVCNGLYMEAHTNSFNPGNLSVDRIFVDLWNDVTNINGIGIKLALHSTTATCHMNLVSFNRVDIYGGSNLTNSTGILLEGATGSYGETRQINFNDLNIEDVKTAYKLVDASDNTFTNINYTRVLANGTFFALNSESLNNKFENMYLDTATASTYLVINDAGNDADQPNIFTRITGWSNASTTLNGTLAASTVIEHMALTGGSPTIDTDLTNRADRLDANSGFIGDATEYDNGNSSTADTIDWNNGNFHKSTLTGNCTFTFTAPSLKGRMQLRLIQDGTGSRTVTWPATVKWPGGTAPTLTTDASAIDIITFYYDGTNYYAVESLDFS